MWTKARSGKAAEDTMIHTADQSAHRRSLRLLRRLLTMGLAAVIALVGARAVYPTLRKHYYLGRLAAADLRDVGQAMTALANLATDDASVIPPLWSTLVSRLSDPEPDVRDQARYVTSWLVGNVELARPHIETTLAIADDDLFFALAESLILAGAWDVRDRTIDHRARIAVLRYRRAEPASRIHVLATMEELGPAAAVHFMRVLERAVEDPDPTIRTAALGVSAVMGDPASITRIVSRLDDAFPTVRRAALLWLSRLPAKAHIGDIAMRLDDADPTVRRAAIWAVSRIDPERSAQRITEIVRADPNAVVRQAALMALARCTPGDEAIAEILAAHLADTHDEQTCTRAALAIADRREGDRAVPALVAAIATDRYPLQLAGIAALGTVTTPDHQSVAIPLLRRLTNDALVAGNGDLVAATLDALAALHDKPFVQVHVDIADRATNQPMLRYRAATAAIPLDPALGEQALLNLFDLETDTVRDLVAWRVAQFDVAPTAELIERFESLNDETRMAAALALGVLRADDAIVRGQPLLDRLRQQTDEASAHYEVHWKVRGYKNLARWLLGDETARPAVDALVLNENFPRTALLLGLLANGDLTPLHVLLASADDDSIDLDAFLRDARMADIIAAHFPAAPRITWHADPVLRRWQIARLRDWWRIMRHRVRWDPAERRFMTREM